MDCPDWSRCGSNRLLDYYVRSKRIVEGGCEIGLRTCDVEVVGRIVEVCLRRVLWAVEDCVRLEADADVRNVGRWVRDNIILKAEERLQAELVGACVVVFERILDVSVEAWRMDG